MNALKESDLRLFVDSVRRYFDVTSRIEPEITSAFLGMDHVPGHDFNGIVHFSGRYRGQVVVSLPAAALKELLLSQRKTDLSQASLLDAVGEIANTVAGNARKSLGKDLEISVPKVVHGKPSDATRTRQHPYVITFRWNRYPGVVCVDLAEAA